MAKKSLKPLFADDSSEEVFADIAAPAPALPPFPWALLPPAWAGVPAALDANAEPSHSPFGREEKMIFGRMNKGGGRLPLA